jgi:hypothetical protein
MRVAHTAGAPYDYMTPRPTRDGDFAAQRIPLMRLSLGDTAYGWFMEAVALALIFSLWAHPTLHDWKNRGIPLLLTPLDQLPTEIAHLAPC